jgi:1-deoxy-D-xylulose-5-phosphate synthase
LASNLGVVELTVALHTVFDLDVDRLVFDVGHQSYVHKILTGRRDGFPTLRKLGGLSGFPRPDESPYDAFISGHASNAVSAALGLARARTINGEHHRVIALLGDGALTGGLAYEGLSDAGASGEPLVIVLNDNGMSITKNVGGVARYLSRQRIKPSYLAFKRWYRRFTERIPGGKAVYRFTHVIKTRIKHAILRCSMFEEMGFEYIGPVDGHDVKTLRRALEWARDIDSPTLLHVITRKGRGYTPAEEAPERYHGVGVFNPAAGEHESMARTFSSVFGVTMCQLAEKVPNLCAITAAMTSGTGLTPFASLFPDRFFDVGIAEGHAVTLAAGLAAGGALPVFAVYSTFLQRGYDMLLHDIALMNRQNPEFSGVGSHSVFAIDRAGLVPGDGETHQGVYDVPFLATVPGMTVYAPSSYAELRDMLARAVLEDSGPVAVRYPKGEEGRYRDGGADASLVLRSGDDLTIVTYGVLVNSALDAAEILERSSVSATVIKLGRIQPIEYGDIERSVRKTRRLLVLEDCVEAGSVGERVIARLNKLGAAPIRVKLINAEGQALPCGTVEELRRICGLDVENIVDSAMELTK